MPSPGVYWVRDPRSRVYNFSPRLESIPQVKDFDFGRVAGFIKSSRDDVSTVLTVSHNLTPSRICSI